MSTLVKGTAAGYTVGGLPQNYSINEGTLSQTIAPITITSLGNSYGDYFHAQFYILGSAQAASILLNCAALNGLSLTRTGNYYTLTSNKVVNGVTVNNWAYFKKALANLSLQFTNSDISQSFSLLVTIWAGSDPNPYLNPIIAGNQINININSIPDATGLNQTFNVTQAFNSSGNQLSSFGGANIQIADLQEAMKTYRVTYTVNNVTNGTGTSSLIMSVKNAAAGIDEGWIVDSYSVSGTQAYINGIFTNSGADGFRVHQHSGNFYGTQTISYVQEVLTTTEPGAVVPYVQETGTLTFNIAHVPPFTITPGFTYTEDSSFSLSAGTLTDPTGLEWPWETAANELNFYTMTVTALGSFSGSNPITVTYSGDASPNYTATFTGSHSYFTNGANPPNNITVIPPADYTDDITLQVTISRGDGFGVTGTIFTGNIVVVCDTQHADFSLNGSQTFVIGANSFNFGSITDLAVSKAYSVTMDFQTAIAATLGSSGSGGASTWNATGGVGGFGRLTLTGTKTQVNSHLAAINYTTTGGATLDDFVNIIYTQTQTTNSVSQGTQNVLVGNIINWRPGNGIHLGQDAFVYDQDVTMTWDLASIGPYFDNVTNYTAKLIFSTPLSVANLGSVTGWTRETDYIWTKTDTRANLNAALAAIQFVPPAQLISDFQLDIAVYNGGTLLKTTASGGLNSTKTVYLRTPVEIAWTGSALSYDQDTVTTWPNIATLNSNFNAGTYTLELVTSVATGGTLTGWTTVNSTTFSKTDTTANLQAALNSLVFTPSLTFVSNFTFTLKSYRSSLLLNTSVAKNVSIGVVYGFYNTGATLTFDQDNTVTWDMGEFSSNFDAAKTYTIELVTSVASVGAFTGWTTVNTTTYSKTGTGAALIAAMNALEFVPSISGQVGFTITTKIIRSATLVFTSTAKSIAISAIYSIAVNSVVYDEDTTTIVNMGSLNSVFQAATTYTLNINLSGAFSGTITGWTKTSSTLFTKTDTKTNLESALSSMSLVSPTGFRSNLTFNITAYKSATLIATSSTASFIGNLYSVASQTSGFVANVSATHTFGSISPRFLPGTTYTAKIIFTTDPRTATIAGWTLSGNTYSLTATGSAITAALTTTFLSDPYSMGNLGFTIAMYSGATLLATSSSASLVNSSGMTVTWSPPGNYMFTWATPQTYTPAVILTNFDASLTYKARLTGSQNFTVTGWSGGSSVSHDLTDTLPNLITALNSLEIQMDGFNTGNTISCVIFDPSDTNPVTGYSKANVTGKTFVSNILLNRVGPSSYTYTPSVPSTYNLFTFTDYDSRRTYTAILQLTFSTSATVTGWTSLGGGQWQKIGTGADIDAALQAVEITPSVSDFGVNSVNVTITDTPYVNLSSVWTPLNHS